MEKNKQEPDAPPAASPQGQELFNEALQLHQAGRLGEAEQAYRRILAVNPGHAYTLHMMGMLAFDVRRFDVAEDFVRKSIAELDHAVFHRTLGNILNARGKMEDAIASYQKSLAMKPDSPDCLNNLAATFISLKRYDEALAMLQRILDKDSRHFSALSNMGAILQNQQKYDEAIEYYRRTLEVKPDAASVHYDMAKSFKALGRTQEAKAAFEKAFESNSDYADALLQIAQILRDENKPGEALQYYRRVTSIRPDGSAEANIGQILHQQGHFEQAIDHYKQAHDLAPDSCKVLNNMGITYKTLGKYEEAMECYMQALALDPDLEETLSNLSGALKNLGRLEESIAYSKKAIALAPGKTWIYSNLLLSMIYASFVSPEELMAETKKFGDMADRFIRTRELIRDLDLERKLRVGYVTADFNDHAVNYFFEPLLKKHDRTNFEIYAYANVEREDAVTERLKKEFDCWRDIKFLDDDEAADLIEVDKIDILVDISGHTRGNRLMTFARKPAPVQVTWLAYPGTTGMKAMDYRITDSYAEPPGMTEHLNTETLWRLPEIFCCYQGHESNPAVIDHPPCEDKGYITFGCFNNFSKVTDPVLDAWAKIMARVADARLLLEIAGIESLKIRTEIERRLKDHGLPMDRVILEPRKKSNQFVLYNKIDIALDPFPCVGGTTSMDTLWMGVPLISLAGKQFVSRMGVTILGNAGLSELVTDNIDDYISLAVELAADRKRLKNLRRNLRDRVTTSPLMNQERFARNMEDAYREMWKKYCHSKRETL